jgi:environmental stress-induced protein Ves
MQMNIKTKEEFSTTAWAGGETTELFIYPPEGTYQEREFLFRLSSATVKDNISTFTKLSGIKRKLLVLEGKIRLSHNSNKGKWLFPNNQEEFSGDWDTVSEGEVIDFNLMMKQEVSGNITHIQLPAQDKENCVVYVGPSKKCFLFLYVWEGQITIEDGYEKKIIREKELAIIEMDKETKVGGVVIENQFTSKARIVKTEVYLT